MKYKSNKKQIQKELRRKMEDSLEEMGELLLREVKQNAPVDSGDLRDSYDIVYNEEELSLQLGSPLDYSVWVELGSSRNKAQPHLEPSVKDNKNDLETIVEKYLSRIGR